LNKRIQKLIKNSKSAKRQGLVGTWFRASLFSNIWQCRALCGIERVALLRMNMRDFNYFSSTVSN